MSVSVADSYRACAQVARRAASSFYWSFWLLPAAKYQAMCALYAFSRHTDDLGDDARSPAERLAALDAWRRDLGDALAGDCRHPLLPALVHTVRQYNIPPQLLFEIIEGVLQDQAQVRFATFEELEQYCRRVASAVGEACLHIWGVSSDAAFEPARTCGIAFQLTNILRDLPEDMQRGRVYLPQEDLDHFGYTVEELADSRQPAAYRALIRFEIERANQHYLAGRVTRQYLSPDGRRAFDLMFLTYHRLLELIRQREGDVFTRRPRLTWLQKLLVLLRWLWGCFFGLFSSARPASVATPVRPQDLG